MKNNYLKHLKNNPIPWLLESDPWTKYKTLIDLLDLPASSKEVKIAKQELKKDAFVTSLIKETSDWILQIKKSHRLGLHFYVVGY